MKLPHRLSIAGLMTIVLIFSLGLVALRSESGVWAGGVYLLTYGVLLLAVVGAVCRTGAERAGWLGFALFGIAYFRWNSYLGFGRVPLPTTSLLDLIRPDGVVPFDARGEGPFSHYWLVGHCFWSLLAATIGGGLALALFAAPGARSAELDVQSRQESRLVRVKWRGAVAVGLALLVPVSALILVSPLSYTALWASALYLSTWLVLGIAVLGFACGRGKRRMIWFGAALFGLGYMILNRSVDRYEQHVNYVHVMADEFLESIRPMLPEVVSGFPAKTAAMAKEHARIRRILDRKVSMPYHEATPLEDFLKDIRATTKAVDGRELTIFVDPLGLQDCDKSMQSTIQIDIENCSLNTALRIALRPLGLSPSVRNGMVYITCPGSDDEPRVEIDYYLLVGHCFLALVSAGLGAIFVPLVSHREAGVTA